MDRNDRMRGPYVLHNIYWLHDITSWVYSISVNDSWTFSVYDQPRPHCP